MKKTPAQTCFGFFTDDTGTTAAPRPMVPSAVDRISPSGSEPGTPSLVQRDVAGKPEHRDGPCGRDTVSADGPPVEGRLGARKDSTKADRMDLSLAWTVGQQIRRYARAEKLTVRDAGARLLVMGFAVVQTSQSQATPHARGQGRRKEQQGEQQGYECPDASHPAQTKEGRGNATN